MEQSRLSRPRSKAAPCSLDRRATLDALRAGGAGLMAARSAAVLLMVFYGGAAARSFLRRRARPKGRAARGGRAESEAKAPRRAARPRNGRRRAQQARQRERCPPERRSRTGASAAKHRRAGGGGQDARSGRLTRAFAEGTQGATRPEAAGASGPGARATAYRYLYLDGLYLWFFNSMGAAAGREGESAERTGPPLCRALYPIQPCNSRERNSRIWRISGERSRCW